MCVLSWKDTLWIVDGIALFMMLPRRRGCFSMSRHVASCGRVLCSFKERIFPMNKVYARPTCPMH